MADTKLTALTETTSPATSDDVYVVTTPGGTPASKRCTIANLKTAMGAVTRSGSTTDAHYAVWNGSNADSIKDGGAAELTDAWTDYSASTTLVGFSGTTAKVVWYKKMGKAVFVNFKIQGTSNAATFTFTLPDNAVVGCSLPVRVESNSVYGTAPGLLEMSAGSNVVTLYKDFTGAAFAAGNEKYGAGTFFYIVA